MPYPGSAEIDDSTGALVEPEKSAATREWWFSAGLNAFRRSLIVFCQRYVLQLAGGVRVVTCWYGVN